MGLTLELRIRDFMLNKSSYTPQNFCEKGNKGVFSLKS